MSNFIPNVIKKIIPRDPPWITKALKTMIRSALKSMSGDSLNALFVGLPPEKQFEIKDLLLMNDQRQ